MRSRAPVAGQPSAATRKGIVLIVVLVFRPSGLLGERVADRA